MLAILRRLLRLRSGSRESVEQPSFNDVPREELLERFDALPQSPVPGGGPYRKSLDYQHPTTCPFCEGVCGAVRHYLIDPRHPTDKPPFLSEVDIHKARKHARPLPRDAARFLAQLC